METNTVRGFGAPFRYLQGPGEFEKIGEYVSAYGQKAFVLIDGTLFNSIGARFSELAGSRAESCLVPMNSGCTRDVINTFRVEADAWGTDVIVGIGGGRTLDTAKMVAELCAVPRIIVPTSSSTDAPTSSMSVLYTESGEFDVSVHHLHGSELVLVDSDIIMQAPPRLFAAGMADALCTWYEAAANEKSGACNCIGKGYRQTRAALAIARECKDILLSEGIRALDDVKNGTHSDAVENVIEACILLSGLGFENAGCAGAHAFHTGFQKLPGSGPVLHGEMVSFGLVFQMTLECAPEEERKTVAAFLAAASLPVTMKELGRDSDPYTLKTITDGILYGNSGIESEPFSLSAESIYKALYEADQYGRQFWKD